MLSHCASKIYRADPRGQYNSDTYKCASVFNYGIYEDKARRPFGQIAFFNEEFLAPKQQAEFRCEQDTIVVLIPVKAFLTFTCDDSLPCIVRSEEIVFLNIAAGGTYHLHHPGDGQWAHYLHFGLKGASLQPGISHVTFNEMNKLASLDFEVHTAGNTRALIGIFEGRAEGYYKLSAHDNQIFAYTISGAFEIQNILLEQGEGLQLNHPGELEFEALANHSIVLIIETC